MKVKELKEELNKFDDDKEIVIRFALSNDDEIGYILEPFMVDKYYDDIAIYGGYTLTEKDCNFIGQKDLKKLWEEGE